MTDMRPAMRRLQAQPGVARFQGEYAFLSNFYPALVLSGGIVYPTLEHAYQAEKTLSRLERHIKASPNTCLLYTSPSPRDS